MWLRLNLSGMEFQFRINGYHPWKKGSDDDEWCRVECSPSIGAGAALFASEIEDLAKSLDDLLHDKITEVETIEFLAPDFYFILNPKRDLRENSQYIYIKEGHEIVDIYMDMRIVLWNDGRPTDNFLSLRFDRKNIENMEYYLQYIMGAVKKDDPVIQEMLAKEILRKEYA